jgi:hypothetical protein
VAEGINQTSMSVLETLAIKFFVTRIPRRPPASQLEAEMARGTQNETSLAKQNTLRIP